MNNPFRSHLLQQWARSSQARPPAAIVPWLQNHTSEAPIGIQSSSNGLPPPQFFQDESHDTIKEPFTSSRLLMDGSHLDEFRPSSPQSLKHPPVSSLSHLDSNSVSYTWPMASTISSKNTHVMASQSSRYISTSANAVSVSQSSKRPSPFEAKFSTRNKSSAAAVEPEEDSTTSLSAPPPPSALSLNLQSLMQSRHTSSKLVHQQSLPNRFQEHEALRNALHRAMECALMAPNHKKTEPFSFVRFMAGSISACQLAEIAYNVTLAKKAGQPMAEEAAENKKKKVLSIPAFLAVVVHNNQAAVSTEDAQTSKTVESESNTQGLAAKDDDKTEVDTSKVAQIPYAPPQTERQLEDYAAASAAVQNILLSLHSEGIGSKWATGPIINTQAFRDIVKALPTDRIVGLVMVGGTENTPTAAQKQDESVRSVLEVQEKQRRRRRRRSTDEMLQDLE
eukprot:Nitzschia sp. Nitz4//scaffold144_size56818//10047//11481//NITZ4_006529-RA/size56818-snap-gene-0.8-mRNA-1//-1//CDS//3329536492//7995//frame0